MEQPRIDYYDHPIFRPTRLHLETTAMKKLGEEMHRWLWTGATGGLISGTARVGKTMAVRALASQLYTRGKDPIPAYYLSIPNRDAHTILSVFRQLCWSVNLRVVPHDRADHLSDRFIHYLADQAVVRGCRSAVLIVDEMQRLKPIQFDAFAELYDKLLLLDISLTVIFVGNDPECWRLVALFEQSQYAHIHGRFFTHGVSFLGLASTDEVHACLSQYDSLRYPADGPTYAEYFLTEAVRNGWFLAGLSGDIWRVFRSYQQAYSIESWGMQYFTAAINSLLSDLLPHYGVEHFDDDMVHECIRLSGLIPSLVRPGN